MIVWWMASALGAWPADDEVPTVDLAEEAGLHFRLGVAAYKDAEFNDALDHLLQSHRLAPNRNTAFNVARCYEQLKRPDQAWRFYELSLTGEKGDRKAAEEGLARLQDAVARLRVESDPPGATVYVGRSDLGSRGVTPVVLALPEGDHQVLFELGGHDGAVVTGQATLGSEATVSTTLFPTDDVAKGPIATWTWTSSSLWAGDVELVRAEVGSCTAFPGGAALAGTPRSAPDPRALPPGSVGALDRDVALALDVVVSDSSERKSRLSLLRPGKKAPWLSDGSPVRAWLFDRCDLVDGAAIAAELEALPKKVRLEAAAAFAEAGSTGAAAAACAAGDCSALGADL